VSGAIHKLKHFLENSPVPGKTVCRPLRIDGDAMGPMDGSTSALKFHFVEKSLKKALKIINTKN